MTFNLGKQMLVAKHFSQIFLIIWIIFKVFNNSIVKIRKNIIVNVFRGLKQGEEQFYWHFPYHRRITYKEHVGE